MDLLSFFGSIASVSGISLEYVVKNINKKKKLIKLYDRFQSTLNDLQEDDDPLVGYWLLREWNHTSQHIANYTVSGSLSLYYRDRRSHTWRGIMCLEYAPHPNSGVDNNALAPPFIASYDVSFGQEDNGYFSGESHMIDKFEYVNFVQKVRLWWKRPKYFKNYKWKGAFVDCSVEKEASTRLFSGRFYNLPLSEKSSRADFTFHLPRKWGTINRSVIGL